MLPNQFKTFIFFRIFNLFYNSIFRCIFENLVFFVIYPKIGFFIPTKYSILQVKMKKKSIFTHFINKKALINQKTLVKIKTKKKVIKGA